MMAGQEETKRTVEIERKWLCDGFPDAPFDSEEMQWQGYLSFEPTVRIRAVTRQGSTSYVLTIKGEGTLSKTEVELPLQKVQYEALTGMVAGPMAQKRLRRYCLPEGLTLECSLVDEGQPDAFYYAEVEFATEDDANRFLPPTFLGREVTQDIGYSMAAYCRNQMEKAKGASDAADAAGKKR